MAKRADLAAPRKRTIAFKTFDVAAADQVATGGLAAVKDIPVQTQALRLIDQFRLDMLHKLKDPVPARMIYDLQERVKLARDLEALRKNVKIFQAAEVTARAGPVPEMHESQGEDEKQRAKSKSLYGRAMKNREALMVAAKAFQEALPATLQEDDRFLLPEPEMEAMRKKAREAIEAFEHHWSQKFDGEQAPVELVQYLNWCVDHAKNERNFSDAAKDFETQAEKTSERDDQPPAAGIR